jgi:hypothetical protein
MMVYVKLMMAKSTMSPTSQNVSEGGVNDAEGDGEHLGQNVVVGRVDDVEVDGDPLKPKCWRTQSR